MKRLALAIAFALYALPVLAAEDFSGKWTGSFTGVGPDGTERTESMMVTFVHKGADLTGTAGPSAAQQWAIQKGKVEGNNVAFEVQGDGGGPALKFTLALAEGHLKGSVTAERDGLKLNGKVDIARAK